MEVVFNGVEFAKDIKSIRFYLELNLRDCAVKIGISTATLSRLENELPPDICTFYKVCDFLKQPMKKYFVEKNIIK